MIRARPSLRRGAAYDIDLPDASVTLSFEDTLALVEEIREWVEPEVEPLFPEMDSALYDCVVEQAREAERLPVAPGRLEGMRRLQAALDTDDLANAAVVRGELDELKRLKAVLAKWIARTEEAG